MTKTICHFIWGDSWQTELARACIVQPRTVRRWVQLDKYPKYAYAAMRLSLDSKITKAAEIYKLIEERE